VLAFLDDQLEFSERSGRILLEVLVKIPGIQGHTSMDNDVIGSSFENYRDFVGRADNWDNPFGILDPFENLSLGMGIASVNLVQDHTGLSGVGRILDERREGDRSHTGIT
jgi:hypothetical protein